MTLGETRWAAGHVQSVDRSVDIVTITLLMSWGGNITGLGVTVGRLHASSTALYSCAGKENECELLRLKVVACFTDHK